MHLQDVIKQLEALANPANVATKQNKFGIVADRALGIYQKDLGKLAKQIGPDNQLAIDLFNTGIYEARLLCSYLYHPQDLTDELMEAWVVTFENWEICDSFCMGFFAASEDAIAKAIAWSERDEEFVKRAGFVIMAAYGFVHKQALNPVFEQFLPIIEREAKDDRLYVKKAVNWALRNIGKRNVDLQIAAIATANQIRQIDHPSAQWIAKNALSELEKPNVRMSDYPRYIYRPK
ncbi:DNA alkylation repair protein [filamentous cyanobacterium LEGE 11480]|uniref:DNA alkylation repair protein n=1 Tax=Romeriopsis navalis LEGE 11480 TaxID=2777977 RepID=A0A928VSZ4_9CYAN|nr:DNA alkylation repair protein [Romeriopsis navalis]MBE9031987.1 DNA alkylation repair protein [Romeriopsis navalis LEGE 11480]